MGKGKAYSAEEDVALCRAWMRVSEDPITGSEQKADCFWQAVHKIFRGYGPGEDESSSGSWGMRNPNALRHRWMQVSRAVGKFGGIWHRVDAAHPSGKNSEDILKDAIKACEDIANAQGERKREKLPYVECWKILRLARRWAGQTVNGHQSGRKRMLDRSAESEEKGVMEETMEIEKKSSSGAVSSVQRSSVRPRGRKKAKFEKRRMASNDRLGDELASIARAMDSRNMIMLLSMP